MEEKLRAVYVQVSEYISKWQFENVGLSLIETNEKFKKDFSGFVEKFDLPEKDKQYLLQN